MRIFRIALLMAALLVLGVEGPNVGARPSLPEAGMATKRSVDADVAGYDKQHGPQFDFECMVTTIGANTNLDCDDPLPNNEPDIEVNPANPLHMIAWVHHRRGYGGAAPAGVVGTSVGASAGLEMTGVPPNSAPRPRPKAGFAMRAECRRAGELSISVRLRSSRHHV